MSKSTDARGFTLVEILVVLGLLSAAVTGFYMVLFSGARSADTTEDLATIAQEARLGFNRMIRDTREAQDILGMSPTSYTVEVDFDSNGIISPADFERITYAFDPGAQRITLSNGTVTETLMEGVSQIGSRPLFAYFSSKLEYDYDGDGVTSVAELNTAAASGANLGLNYQEALITEVRYAFSVRSGDRASEFYTQAQLRNRR